MSNETKKVVEGAVATKEKEVITTEVKKNRRGLGSAKGTQRLKFTHKECIPNNGLFIGHLDSVVLSSLTIGEDKVGTPSFNGLELPKLIFTFASNEDDTTKRRYVSHAFTPVESNVDTIPGGKSAWKVNSIMDFLKHVLNVFYLKGRELTDDEEMLLSLSYEDFDDNGYVPVDPEIVVAAWKTLFENIENIFNRGGVDNHPIFKTKDGKNVAIWMKLLRFTKIKGVWKPIIKGTSTEGDLGFASFVGEGCIELFKQNVIPSISINAINERITPMEINQAKTPNMPNNIGGSMPMSGGIPNMPMIDSSATINSYDSNIGMSAGEDLPF